MLGPQLKFVDRTFVLFEGKKYLYFGGIDYHRMSNHSEIIQTLADAAKEYGLNSTGSRTTTGNHPIYIELEQKVAEFFATEDAAIFGGGYLANIILLQGLSGKHNLFIADEVSHSSIVDAAKMFNAEMIFFKHTDANDLEQKMRDHVKPHHQPLILTDGVFAARGEIPPLADYAKIVATYDAKILIDDAHAMAVVGKTGKGSWEDEGISRDCFYQTGTLSKGFGIYGGIIPANKKLIASIQQKSAAFIGSTGLPLPVAAAAINSIEYIQKNNHLITDLQLRSIKLKQKFIQLGFDLPQSPSPIISITFYDEKKNDRLYQLLLTNGIYPPFINYPGAPRGGHFRFALSSFHSDAQIHSLYNVVKSSLI